MKNHLTNKNHATKIESLD